MKQIILIKRGSVSKTAISDMRKAGYIPVECSELNEVVAMTAGANQLKTDIILNSALVAMTGTTSSTERERFGHNMIQALTQKSK